MAKWYKEYSDGTVERDYNAENTEAIAGGMVALVAPALALLAAFSFVILTRQYLFRHYCR